MNILLDHAIILIVVDGLSPSGKATDSDSVIKGSNPFSPVTIKALIESAFLLVHLKRKAKLLMLQIINAKGHKLFILPIKSITFFRWLWCEIA